MEEGATNDHILGGGEMDEFLAVFVRQLVCAGQLEFPFLAYQNI